MAVVASAEVTLGELDAALAGLTPVPQWLPIDGDPGMTLRDAIAHDSTGPLRTGFGGWRDRLTGCQFTRGDGGLITHGGLPVKNVAGYDLSKLIVGSHGCFGALVTASIRTARRPEAALAARVNPPEDLPAFVNRLLTGDAPPQWMLLRADGLRLGWLGSEREMAALAEVAEAQAGSAVSERTPQADARERFELTAAGRAEGRVRVSVPPREVAAVVAAGSGAVGDPVFGVVWAGGGSDGPVAREAGRRGGHGIAFESYNQLKTIGPSMRPEADLLTRLKRAFDPEGMLVPLPIDD
jgi:glycolate oxidase FAD binding subunit